MKKVSVIKFKYVLLIFSLFLIIGCEKSQTSIKLEVSVSKITSNSFIVSGSIKNEYDKDYNYVIATHPKPTIDDDIFAAYGNRDSLFGHFYGLLPNTEYYVRLYTIYFSNEIQYSDELIIRTKDKIILLMTEMVKNMK